ncbi:hypothetical protein NDU88_010875 [Pleurodeles waltl]|uniref:Uncharacterized protein n=1 Tax=Pleurodeles waltl TaxID=8319 RepID=A0AAV7RZG0_PLEWA|nr:hypothetical protein NDU88_010875 [Pleurodeles waltl]
MCCVPARRRRLAQYGHADIRRCASPRQRYTSRVEHGAILSARMRARTRAHYQKKLFGKCGLKNRFARSVRRRFFFLISKLLRSGDKEGTSE